MKKVNYKGTELEVMYQENEIGYGECIIGNISRKGDGFLFEEQARRVRAPRNPKLYDGQYCSLVHRKDGRYQLHVSTFTDLGSVDVRRMVREIHKEMVDALKCVQ